MSAAPRSSELHLSRSPKIPHDPYNRPLTFAASIDLPWGPNKGHPTTVIALAGKPSNRKGKQSARSEFVKNIVREVRPSLARLFGRVGKGNPTPMLPHGAVADRVRSPLFCMFRSLDSPLTSAALWSSSVTLRCVSCCPAGTCYGQSRIADLVRSAAL